MWSTKEAVTPGWQEERSEIRRFLCKFDLVVAVHGVHNAEELGGGRDGLEDIVCAWKGVNWSEDGLVELFVINNKPDATLSPWFWHKETWAAPLGWFGDGGDHFLL